LPLVMLSTKLSFFSRSQIPDLSGELACRGKRRLSVSFSGELQTATARRPKFQRAGVRRLRVPFVPKNPDGVDLNFSSTQFSKGWWEVTERFFGTKGTSQSPYTGPLGIWATSRGSLRVLRRKYGTGGVFRDRQVHTSNLEFADREKKKAFVRKHHQRQFHNQADKGAGICAFVHNGPPAAYTGLEVSWEETLKSRETWDRKLT